LAVQGRILGGFFRAEDNDIEVLREEWELMVHLANVTEEMNNVAAVFVLLATNLEEELAAKDKQNTK
jgi:hypothetical protein